MFKVLPNSYNQILCDNRQQILKVLQDHFDDLENVQIECYARNSAIMPLNIENINARIEFGALIRDHVIIEDYTVIMMGAILNVGCTIGSGTLVDMGEVIGVRVGRNAVVAAGAVVTEDVAEGVVVVECPARVIKLKDKKTESKTQLVETLREL